MPQTDFNGLVEALGDRSTIDIELDRLHAKRLRNRFYAWRRTQRAKGRDDLDFITAGLTATGIRFEMETVNLEDAALEDALYAQRPTAEE